VLGVGAALVRPRAADLLPLLAAGAYLAASLGSTYNIGARHLLPLIPLLALVAAARAAVWPAAARVVALAALASSPAVAFPHYIAHFSLLVGGPERGARILNDSNLDWGQDWLRLARAARDEGWKPLTVVYLGAADPTAHLPAAASFIDDLVVAAPGYVAVSRYAAALGPDYLAVFREHRAAHALEETLAALREQGRRVAVIGHSIDVYWLPDP
jgi:hypothetical protein